MPFGLCNAPATFQRALAMLLCKVKWKYALVYLDDVIIYSKSIEEHFEQLDYVLSILRNAGGTLKLSKCHFFQSSVNYLGHGYSGKLAVAQKNIDTLAQAHHLRTRTELRSYLGMCNVYRKFVSGFVKIAAPLTDMLRKGEPDIFDELTEAQARAFSQLKNALINPQIF
jgi:Reverse transcriptase (RNA-dependent DNA polymerase)